MAYDYKNINNASNVGGGISDRVLFAPFRDIDVIAEPTPGSTPAPGDEVLITTSHLFFTGKGFREAISAPNKSSMGAKTVGEMGSKKFEQTTEIFLPGSYKELHEQMSHLINERLIILGKDANCAADMWIQHGNKCHAVYVDSAEFGTGTVDGQTAKGYKITLKNYTGAILQYKGTITMQP